MEIQQTKPKRSPWRLFFRVLRPYWGYVILSALFVLLAAICVYLAPFVTSFTLDYVIRDVDPHIPEVIFNFVKGLGGREYFMEHLILCGAVYLAFTVLNGLFTYLRRRSTAYAAEGMAKSLRDSLYEHINAVPYDYHKHVSTGDLVQRCTSDVETVRRFLSVQMMDILRTAVMFFTALVILLRIHVPMALISMVTLPFLVISSFIYFRYVQKYFKDADEAEGQLSAALQENLTGVRIVRAFGQERAEYEKLTKLNAKTRDATIRLNRLLGYYWGMSDAVGFAQIGISLAAGVYFCARGTMTLGLVTLFSTYTTMLTWPARQLGRILADMGKASVSLKRLTEIMDAEPEKEPGKALTVDMTGDICFDHVCFGYDAPDDVLKDISFTVKPGETVAILGATGSGKSSLVQLLQRLYTCTRGKITIGGVDINDIDHTCLRRSIGIVLQEPFLYSRSIRENIRIVNPTASDKEVEEAARIAAIHDVIMGFEKGYDTLVGERGVTLSGGQLQRVAIARTLMQKAPILIFDDSMSAVDTETDAKIRDALYGMKRDGILFIISHRITTLCEADKILVLEGGRLVDMGTHDELIRKPGLYRRIAEIQDALPKGGDAA